MFAESEHQQNLRFPDWDEAASQPAPPSVRVRKPGADESHWLELTLYQMKSHVRSAGKEAVLYCGTCRKSITYEDVVPGIIQGWPYCPAHREKPLMVCSISLGLHYQETPVPEQSETVSLESGSVAEHVPYE